MWPIFLLLLGWPPTPAEPAGPLLVSAAISLTEALSECGRAFTAATGIGVRFNFGPSNALARQIVEGAPVDVFVSADEAQMQTAIRAGAVRASQASVVAANRLVIVVPDGPAGGPWPSAAPLTGAGIRRLAIGDPRAVPAGVYAKAWLQRIGLWGALQPKLVPTASVRGALAAVRSGAADAGIVYATDVRVAGGVRVALEIAGSDAPAIVYPAGIVARTSHAVDARRFVEFLRGEAGQRILQRHGFGRAPVSVSP